MDNYSNVMYSSNLQFKDNYLRALLISLCYFVAIVLNIIVIKVLSTDSGMFYQVITFTITTVTSYLAIHISLKVIRDQEIYFEDIFKPMTKLLNFAVYSLVVLAVEYFVGRFVGEIEIDLIYTLVEPFYGFLMGASSIFGFSVRLVIAFNIIMLPLFFIGVIAMFKFVMIPYYLVEGTDLVTAIGSSWENTNGYFASYLKIMFNVYVKLMIFISIFLLFMFNQIMNNPFSSTGEIYEYILYGVLLLIYIPYVMIVMATLFDDLA